MSGKYEFHNPSAAYFVSFATVYWIDVFTREFYLDILVERVAYCRKYKGMELFAYCFMPSHVHLIFRAKNENPTELLRAFKSYTSKTIIEAISQNNLESRKEWLFKNAAPKQGNVAKYQFWQHHNKPIELWSTSTS